MDGTCRVNHAVVEPNWIRRRSTKPEFAGSTPARCTWKLSEKRVSISDTLGDQHADE